jgi:hypothetical protein
MTKHLQTGLCFNYVEPFTRSRKCSHLFDITTINDYDANDVDNNLLMMLGMTQFAVHACRPMYLAGAVFSTGAHILVNTGATHNVIDDNFIRLIDLLEKHINTMTLVGSGNEVSCREASFSVPLCIDAETFQSDAFLLDISNDVDTILGTPGLANLDRDFTAMELHYYHDRCPISFTTVLRRRTP